MATAFTSSQPEWIFLVRITIRVKTPSMPNPPIAAWKRSAFSSLEQVRRLPSGSRRSNSRIASPIVPTAKLFLPWMFIAAVPASVGNCVPDTTRGHQPCGSAVFQSCSIVTPDSHSAMPVSGSKSSTRFMRVTSSTCPVSLTLASP